MLDEDGSRVLEPESGTTDFFVPFSTLSLGDSAVAELLPDSRDAFLLIQLLSSSVTFLYFALPWTVVKLAPVGFSGALTTVEGGPGLELE